MKKYELYLSVWRLILVADAFMITGPSTKITNLGAVKIVLRAKRFTLYIAFAMAFAFLSGLLIDLAA